MKHKYFQQALTNANTFTECEVEKATHYYNPATGNYESIAKLLASNAGDDIHLDVNGEVITNVPKNDVLPEPLPMPVMNFGDDADEQAKADDGEHLMIPSMNFDKKEKKDNKQTKEDGLPMPVMKF